MAYSKVGLPTQVSSEELPVWVAYVCLAPFISLFEFVYLYVLRVLPLGLASVTHFYVLKFKGLTLCLRAWSLWYSFGQMLSYDSLI